MGKWCSSCSAIHQDGCPKAPAEDKRADLSAIYASDVRPQKGGRYVRCRCGCGQIFNLRAWPHNHPWPYPDNEARSDLAFPMVIRDGLPDIMNPLNGRPIDSKRALRKQYRAAGVEEVGDDKSHVRRERYEPDLNDIVADIRKQKEIWESDNMSNDQLHNMLQESPTSAMGMQCGVGMQPTELTE